MGSGWGEGAENFGARTRRAGTLRRAAKALAVLLAFLFLLPRAAMADVPERRPFVEPGFYWLWGGGNCVWFAWQMAWQEWGIKLPWAGDARNWVKLEGAEVSDDRGVTYRMVAVDWPVPRSVMVMQPEALPEGSYRHFGHVAWVTDVKDISVDYGNGKVVYTGWKQVDVLESSVWPPAGGERWHGAWYRKNCYMVPPGGRPGVKFLAPVPVASGQGAAPGAEPEGISFVAGAPPGLGSHYRLTGSPCGLPLAEPCRRAVLEEGLWLSRRLPGFRLKVYLAGRPGEPLSGRDPRSGAVTGAYFTQEGFAVLFALPKFFVSESLYDLVFARALAHEVGHAVWFRWLDSAERARYAALRGIAPWDEWKLREAFAEDFRLTFGSETASVGDSDITSDRPPERVKDFLREIIAKYSERRGEQKDAA